MTSQKLLHANTPELDNPPSSPLIFIYRDEGTQRALRTAYYLAIFMCMLFMLRGCGSDPAWSAEIPQDKAVKILVGEASNQGFKGMVCVAEVLRRQGSTKGFHGLNASHSAHEPKWVWTMARKAWYASLHTNYTHLADHFENIHAFGCPYWVKNCVKTFTYKDHQFYREI